MIRSRSLAVLQSGIPNQKFCQYVNVKKTISLCFIGGLAILAVACGGGGATPTRTRVAEAEPTQTPWIILVPVTVTPGPATATLEPTVTPNVPPTNPPPPTRPPATPRPVTPTPPPAAVEQPTTAPAQPTGAETAPTVPPTAAPEAACGQTYQVTTLTFPENGAKRRAKAGSGAGATIQFKWEPIAGFELDPKIGYRVNIRTPQNSAALYISHNAYLKEKLAILNQQATYGLTLGDDTTASWSVDVIHSTGEFNDAGDDGIAPLGTITSCGPTSPTFTIELAVVE